jgi:hypothetical protein
MLIKKTAPISMALVPDGFNIHYRFLISILCFHLFLLAYLVAYNDFSSIISFSGPHSFISYPLDISPNMQVESKVSTKQPGAVLTIYGGCSLHEHRCESLVMPFLSNP